MKKIALCFALAVLSLIAVGQGKPNKSDSPLQTEARQRTFEKLVDSEVAGIPVEDATIRSYFQSEYESAKAERQFRTDVESEIIDKSENDKEMASEAYQFILNNFQKYKRYRAVDAAQCAIRFVKFKRRINEMDWK